MEHPRWPVWRAVESRIDVDVAALYGEPFLDALARPAASAFVAVGSRVEVLPGVALDR